MHRTYHRTSSCLAVALALAASAGAVDRVNCHIHPPGSSPEQPRGTVGPFASLSACEEERARRFGATGRCHCAADFSPRWLVPAEPPRPGDSPLG